MQTAKKKFCPPEARKAQHLFERWRATKQGRERIPPELWKSAVDPSPLSFFGPLLLTKIGPVFKDFTVNQF